MLKVAICLLAVAACSGDDSNNGDDTTPGDGGGTTDAPPFTDGVSTLSGGDEAAFVDGPRGVARFNNPVGVTFSNGQVFVADFDNGKVRAVDASTGETSTLVDQPNFRRPFAIA